MCEKFRHHDEGSRGLDIRTAVSVLIAAVSLAANLATAGLTLHVKSAVAETKLELVRELHQILTTWPELISVRSRLEAIERIHQVNPPPQQQRERRQ